MQQLPTRIPTTVLPDEYSMDGIPVSKEQFEEAQRIELGDIEVNKVAPEVPSRRQYFLDNEEVSEQTYLEETADKPVTASTRKGRREQRAQQQTDIQKIEENIRLAKEKEFGKTITLEDIYGSFRLQELGVMPGDIIKDNELERVFSTDADEIDIQEVITEEAIAKSKTLRDLGAVKGDLIINKGGQQEFLSRGSANQTKQAVHEFIKNPNYLANASAFFDAIAPMPEYVGATSVSGVTIPTAEESGLRTVEDIYGEDITKLPFEERRLAVKRRKERMVLRMMGPMFEYNPESGGATTGAVLKAVIDPINLIPAASTVKGGIMLGTAIAGFGSMADDFVYSEAGEVDPTKALVSAAVGGTLSGVVVKGSRVLMDRSAKKYVRKAQIKVDKGLRDGVKMKDIPQFLEQNGVNLDRLAASQKRTNIKVNISPKKAAEKQLEETVVNDSSVGRLTNSGVDKVLGVLSTRVKAINERIFGKLRKLEYDSHVNIQAALKEVEAWSTDFLELPAPTQREIARLLYNEDFDAARGLMSRGLADHFDMSVLPLLSRVGDELLESGHKFQKIENYFPRLVKDLRGLQDSLGVEQKGLIRKAQERYAASKKISIAKITPEENAEIIDNLVRGYNLIIKNGKPSFLRQRKLTLTDDQMQYYADPVESLAVYLRRAVSDVEKRKFLGNSKVIDSGTGRIDYDTSIGDLVRKEVEAGRLRMEDEVELIEMLKSRFIGGEQSPKSVYATIRDLGYMGTIANPISAIVQLGDLGTSGALHGFRNTISSLFQTKNFKLTDLGIDEVSKELSEASARGTAKALNNLMGKAGFKFMDRLGKETIINAAYKNAAKLAKTEKGLKALKKKLGSTYGDETDALIADLQQGAKTGRVKMFLFNELSDAQPISLSEFPQHYLDNPDQRILYMLKSFTLKQIDIVRRNVVQEYAKGNKTTAIKNATLLAAYLTVANTGTQVAKDLVLGRDVNIDDLPTRALWALLGVYGMNKYAADKYWSKGDWVGAVANQVAPAAPFISGAFDGVTEPFEEDPDLGGLVRPLPIVGPLIYNWFLDGADKHNERMEKERRKRDKFQY